jgi:hypothetical protein
MANEEYLSDQYGNKIRIIKYSNVALPAKCLTYRVNVLTKDSYRYQDYVTVVKENSINQELSPDLRDGILLDNPGISFIKTEKIFLTKEALKTKKKKEKPYSSGFEPSQFSPDVPGLVEEIRKTYRLNL